MLLKDKVAIITGAASPRGLGFATAKLFAENGAKVVILDLDAQASKNAADILGAPHLGVAANVANEQQVNAAIEQVLGKYGRIDILVNNAGITQPIKTMDIKRENYDAVLDVSLRGTLLMSQAVIPTMRAQKSGSIVCISSVSAQRGGGIFGGRIIARPKPAFWVWQKPWRVNWALIMCVSIASPRDLFRPTLPSVNYQMR